MRQKKVNRKVATIRVNDIFDELSQENNRLENELLFANKCINILYKFKYYLNRICDNFGDNLDPKLAQELNQLEIEYKEIIDEKQNQNKSNKKSKQRVIEENPVFKEEFDQNCDIIEVNNDINEDYNNDYETNEKLLIDNKSGIQLIDTQVYGMNETKLDLNQNQNEVKVKREVKSRILNKYKNMQNNKNNKNNKYTFKCDWIGCNFITNRNSRLKAHHNYHTGNRPVKCTVFGCDKAFVGRESLTTHIKCVHNSERVIKCDILKCIRRAKIVKKMKPTIKILSDDKPYACEYPDCTYRSRTRQSLREHRLTHCERNIECTFSGCKKVFKNKKQLKNHILTHSVEPPHKCKFDGCDAAFRTYKSLKIHKLRHTNETPNFPCDWPGCEFSSVYNWILQRHRMIHTGEKPFKCSWPSCESTFRRNHYLKAHMLKHSGEKPYACDWPGCERRFQSRQALRLHNEKTHGNQIIPNKRYSSLK